MACEMAREERFPWRTAEPYAIYEWRCRTHDKWCGDTFSPPQSCSNLEECGICPPSFRYCPHEGGCGFQGSFETQELALGEAYGQRCKSKEAKEQA